MFRELKLDLNLSLILETLCKLSSSKFHLNPYSAEQNKKRENCCITSGSTRPTHISTLLMQSLKFYLLRSDRFVHIFVLYTPNCFTSWSSTGSLSDFDQVCVKNIFYPGGRRISLQQSLTSFGKY